MAEKKKLIAIISSITAVLLVVGIICMVLFIPRVGEIRYNPWTQYDEFSKDDICELTMQKDKDFKILQLSDIQIIVHGKNVSVAKKQIDKMVKAENPDLIVLTGDNVAGPFGDMMLKQIIKIMESTKTPWALVWGNHDTEGRADENYLNEVLLNADTEYMLYQAGPSNISGSGNYVVNIMDNARSKVVYSLQLIDSNEYVYRADGNEYDYIDYDQQAYFEWIYKNMQVEYAQTDIKSMAFYHISPIELKYMIDELIDNGAEFPITSKDSDKILDGEFNEGVCSALINSGMFMSGKVTNTTHTFNGHDHINNASVLVEVDGYSQIVTYCTKTGTGSYSDDKLQGGTIITITENSDVSIRHLYVNEI